MSLSDPPRAPRAPRAPRKARPKLSLKMQAIGFLSRREHSRQELRAKLLDSLRRCRREEAALAAAADAAAKELAQASADRSSNGIDDAFAPPTSSGVASPFRASSGSAPRRASLLDNVRLASGDPLPSRQPYEPRHDSRPDSEPERPLEETDPEAAVDQLLDWLTANKYLSEPRFIESRVNARARKQGVMMIRHELSRHGLALEPEQAAALRESEFARAQALWQRKFGEIAADARGRAKQARFLAARGFASDVVRRVIGGDEEF